MIVLLGSFAVFCGSTLSRGELQFCTWSDAICGPKQLTTTLSGMIRLFHYLCSLPAIILAGRPLVMQDSFQYQNDRHNRDVKVPVQLGVMSRCPDALLCESVFNQVLEKVARKIKLSLTYVAEFVRISSHLKPNLPSS